MSIPKHIAVVVPSLTSGGAERVAETLAREFAKRTAVTIVTVEPRLGSHALRTLPALPWSDRVPSGCRHVHLASGHSGLLRLAPLIVRFAALARQERFDCVYSFLTWTNVLVAAARILNGGYRHVASEHSMVESLRSDGRQLAWLSKILPLVYRLPDWIVVVSNAARASLIRAGSIPRPQRALTIPNPIDIEGVRRLANAPLDEAAFPPGGSVVVCVARLHVQKDHLTLLRAMTLLPASVVLVLIGDGLMRKQLETAAARLELAERVIFLGVVPNPYPFMRRARAVVLPSKEEGFGLVAVEAAVIGTAFVGSDAGGLKEVCDLLGHRTFPTGDHNALAASITEAMAESACRTRVDEAILQKFGAPNIAREYLELGASSQPEGSSGGSRPPTPTNIRPEKISKRMSTRRSAFKHHRRPDGRSSTRVVDRSRCARLTLSVNDRD